MLYIQVPLCPEDYMLFLESMYNLFGSKWLKLHCGPMWAFEPVMQQTGYSIDSRQRPVNVRTYTDYTHSAICN